MSEADRIAELEDEVAFLRSELGIADHETLAHNFRTRFGVTPCQSQILAALYSTKRAVSYDRLLQAVPLGQGREIDEPGWQGCKVQICRLRKKIGFYAIEAVHGFGFILTDYGRRVIEGVETPEGRLMDPFRELLARLIQQHGLHEGERRYHAQITGLDPDVQAWRNLGERKRA